jgi:hypothetical protein
MTALFARPLIVFAAALAPAAAMSEDLPPPDPIGKPATTVYRQVMPGGRVIYSDKPVKGAKRQETITIEPAPPATPTANVSGKPVSPPLATEPAPPARVATIPSSGGKTLDEANADVVRAEMLLEDARKRQEAGVEPLPGERIGTASGGSRLSDDYLARQKRLAEEVAVAENVLRKSIAERDSLRYGQSSGR